MRFLSSLGTVLFLMAAAVQYNDPDAPVWITIYLIPAIVCFLSAIGKMHWIVPIIVGCGAYVGFAFLALKVFGQQGLFTEEAREMWGLLLTGLWMDALAVTLLMK